MSRKIKLSDQLRRIVKTCGETRYAISKKTGISQATLSKFVSGERGLPMGTLDQLADYLGLVVQSKRKVRHR